MRIYFLGGLLAILSTIGCGGSGALPTAPASGKVLLDGEPVSGGSITFSPIGTGKGNAGKPASGAVGSDGTFKLGTYSDADGAVIGKHKVTYSPPAPETKTNPDGHSVQVPGKYDGMSVKASEVEIKSGSNTDLKIELGK